MTAVVAATDAPVSADHACDCCGARYHGRGAARGCCGDVLPDGGAQTQSSGRGIPDEAILDAIDAAEAERAINGLPDSQEIAAEVGCSTNTVTKKLRALKAAGKVETYESVVRHRGGGGVVMTAERADEVLRS